MNKLIVLFLLFNSTLAYSNWYSKSFSEDSEYQFWVGVSNPQETEKAALDEAYNEAIKEAIKYNFGFNQKLVESYYQTLTKTESQQESSITINSIMVQKVKPIKSEIKQHDKKFIAFQKIAYPKKEITAEIIRLKNIKKESIIVDTIVEEDQNQVLSKVIINSNPSAAKVTLINKDNNKTYHSTTNAKLIIPTGLYTLEIYKSGYKSISLDYIVGLSNKDSLFNLEKKIANLFIDIEPHDSKVKINNKILTNKTTNEIASGTYFVEISHPNYLSSSFEYIIGSEDNILKHKLIPKNSALHIKTEPEDARVYVNGDYIGQSPISGVEYQAEQIEISIVKKGYNVKSDVVSINPNKNNIFNFKLSKNH